MTQAAPHTVVIETDGGQDRLNQRLQALGDHKDSVILVCEDEDAAAVRAFASQHACRPEVTVFPEITGTELTGLTGQISAETITFLPLEAPPIPLPPEQPRPMDLQLLIANIEPPGATMAHHPQLCRAFSVRQSHLVGSNAWDPLSILESARHNGAPLQIRPYPIPPVPSPVPSKDCSKLTQKSTVCALIPHFNCEAWLAQCLEGLVNQTRPPDAIVVIDDASTPPPADILKAFPEISLYTAAARSGPYALIQQVITQTRFDAYMLQDADDSSTPDRLALQLAEAERTGAGLIGGWELRHLEGSGISPVPSQYAPHGVIAPFLYPLDVTAALQLGPGYPLLHPTSLLTRTLWRDLGGFATGLRFGGDLEFLQRARYGGILANVPQFVYMRRIRHDSLTGSRDTGLESDARLALRRRIVQSAKQRVEVVANGAKPDLSPLEAAPPIQLNHVCGPALLQASDPPKGYT